MKKNFNWARIILTILFFVVIYLPAKIDAYTDTKTGTVSSVLTNPLSSVLIKAGTEWCDPNSAYNMDGLIGTELITTYSQSCDGCGGCTSIPQQTERRTYQRSVFQSCYIDNDYEECNLTCSHNNTYNYEFNYEVANGNNWESTTGSNVNKCEDLRVKFTPIADWGATLNKNCAQTTKKTSQNKVVSSYTYTVDVNIPPTNFLVCSDASECLSSTSETSLTSDTWGKGVQQMPSGFIESTERSLSSSDSGMACSDGICNATESGNYRINSTAPASTYYGQCRGYGVVMDTPASNIASMGSSHDVRVNNLPPQTQLTLSKNQISPSETIELRCEATDPDCTSSPQNQDKIARIIWRCFNSSNEPVSCFFNDNGAWTEGLVSKDIPLSEMANSYSDTINFRASKEEGYSITCEATDDDANNPMTGMDMEVVQVGGGAIPAGSCSLIKTNPQEDPIEKNTPVTYFAKLMGGVDPISYTWYCDNISNEGETINSSSRELNKTCNNYDEEGKTYRPKLIFNLPGNKTVECNNGVNAKATVEKAGVVGITACIVKVATENNVPVSNEIQSNLNEKINAELTYFGQKDNNTSIVWKVDGQTLQNEDKTRLLEYTFNSEGTHKIEAKMNNVDCEPAFVSIKGSMKWGN